MWQGVIGDLLQKISPYENLGLSVWTRLRPVACVHSFESNKISQAKFNICKTEKPWQPDSALWGVDLFVEGEIWELEFFFCYFVWTIIMTHWILCPQIFSTFSLHFLISFILETVWEVDISCFPPLLSL